MWKTENQGWLFVLATVFGMVVKSQNSKILGDMLVLSVDICAGNDRPALHFFPLFGDRASVCKPDWPGTYCIYQTDLEQGFYPFLNAFNEKLNFPRLKAFHYSSFPYPTVSPSPCPFSFCPCTSPFSFLFFSFHPPHLPFLSTFGVQGFKTTTLGNFLIIQLWSL